MSAYISLLGAIHALKHLPRKGWLERGLPAGDVESVGSHTFGTALLALVLVEAGVISKDVPLDRLLAVALLHDITEGVTGDMTPADNVSPERKAALELDATRAILGGMPGMEGLQSELESFVSVGTAAKKDPVHVIVKQIDKLDMMLQALRYEKESGKDMRDFYEDPHKYLKDGKLLAFFEATKRAVLG